MVLQCVIRVQMPLTELHVLTSQAVVSSQQVAASNRCLYNRACAAYAELALSEPAVTVLANMY